MKTSTDYLASSILIFKEYKKLAEKAIEQLNEEELFWKPEPESNSAYLVMKHLAGNMRSRWINFLTEDGEKPWRDRDNEFEDEPATGLRVTKDEVIKMWNEGWQCVFDALEPLTPADLEKIVYIRSEAHSVMEALNRQVAHYSYHIGQIVYIAKIIRSAQWQTLSIPKGKGKSQEFNDNMMKK